MIRSVCAIFLFVCLLARGGAWAQSIPLPPAPAGVTTFSREGVDFSVIDAPGNAAFSSSNRPSSYPVQGRGSVPYTYALARTEVTTGQWLQFVNAFSTQGGTFTNFAQPIRWGAQIDPTYNGPGTRWRLDPTNPDAAAVPVWGNSWRECAMYCNWLQNGRSSDLTSITHGAYESSTFGFPDNNFFNGFTDQITRSAGAQFWIPSLDEWIKGAFYDPAQQHWWESHYGSNTPPVSGLPGTPGAQTSSGLPYDPLGTDFYIPLNAYGAQSPYGLLSTSGGPHEWFEDAVGPSAATGLPTYRLFMQAAPDNLYGNGDLIFQAGLTGDIPIGGPNSSFRIATVPAPGAVFVCIPLTSIWLIRRKTR